MRTRIPLFLFFAAACLTLVSPITTRSGNGVPIAASTALSNDGDGGGDDRDPDPSWDPNTQCPANPQPKKKKKKKTKGRGQKRDREEDGSQEEAQSSRRGAAQTRIRQGVDGGASVEFMGQVQAQGENAADHPTTVIPPITVRDGLFMGIQQQVNDAVQRGIEAAFGQQQCRPHQPFQQQQAQRTMPNQHQQFQAGHQLQPAQPHAPAANQQVQRGQGVPPAQPFPNPFLQQQQQGFFPAIGDERQQAQVQHFAQAGLQQQCHGNGARTTKADRVQHLLTASSLDAVVDVSGSDLMAFAMRSASELKSSVGYSSGEPASVFQAILCLSIVLGALAKERQLDERQSEEFFIFLARVAGDLANFMVQAVMACAISALKRFISALVLGMPASILSAYAAASQGGLRVFHLLNGGGRSFGVGNSVSRRGSGGNRNSERGDVQGACFQHNSHAGCSYGASCRFRHVCSSCGQQGHIRPNCAVGGSKPSKKSG